MGKIRKITACAGNCFKLIHATKKQECENIVSSAKKHFSLFDIILGKIEIHRNFCWVCGKAIHQGLLGSRLFIDMYFPLHISIWVIRKNYTFRSDPFQSPNSKDVYERVIGRLLPYKDKLKALSTEIEIVYHCTSAMFCQRFILTTNAHGNQMKDSLLK